MASFNLRTCSIFSLPISPQRRPLRITPPNLNLLSIINCFYSAIDSLSPFAHPHTTWSPCSGTLSSSPAGRWAQSLPLVESLPYVSSYMPSSFHRGSSRQLQCLDAASASSIGHRGDEFRWLRAPDSFDSSTFLFFGLSANQRLLLQGRTTTPAAFSAVRSYASDAKASPTEVSSILEQRIRGVQEESGLAETGRVLSVGYV